MNVTIVDYGMGNICSIVGAMSYLGVEDIIVTGNGELLRQADKLLLPGVGNYAKAMERIIALGLDKELVELVKIQKKPILGVCLGMQLLGNSSTESGFNRGLGLIDGAVDRFHEAKLKIPHVGFNQVTPIEGSRLYDGLGRTPDFYFTHSYRMSSRLLNRGI